MLLYEIYLEEIKSKIDKLSYASTKAKILSLYFSIPFLFLTISLSNPYLLLLSYPITFLTYIYGFLSGLKDVKLKLDRGMIKYYLNKLKNVFHLKEESSLENIKQNPISRVSYLISKNPRKLFLSTLGTGLGIGVLDILKQKIIDKNENLDLPELKSSMLVGSIIAPGMFMRNEIEKQAKNLGYSKSKREILKSFPHAALLLKPK